MCERRSHSTTPPDVVADRLTQEGADLVAEPLARRFGEDGGPLDHTLGYRVTEEGMKALQEYEKHHGKPTLRKVSLTHTWPKPSGTKPGETASANAARKPEPEETASSPSAAAQEASRRSRSYVSSANG